MHKTALIDKYAREPRVWRDHAKFEYQAARILFTQESSIVLCFPAATLGHHSLEMYLKAALVCEGFTIFDPKNIKYLVPPATLRKDECAWGHDLLVLAKLLASKRPDFDLSSHLKMHYWYHKMPMSVEQGLAMFNPFFSELRYPQALNQLEGIGPDDVVVLDALVNVIEPFVQCVP